MNLQSQVFPSVTDNLHFQDHILSKTIILTPTQSSVPQEKSLVLTCLLGDLYNEHAEPSLPCVTDAWPF